MTDAYMWFAAVLASYIVMIYALVVNRWATAGVAAVVCLGCAWALNDSEGEGVNHEAHRNDHRRTHDDGHG